ncbi:MAG: 50S ribosomal protein L29 [bacterium]|nr:50S ribosomal protein L29 [bacterium]
MKLEELRKKTEEEILKILQDNREKLRQLRFGLAAGKVKNVREIRKIKKEVARILTLLKRGLLREVKVENKEESSK